MLNESDVDAILQRLIPRYEAACMEAQDARGEYLSLLAAYPPPCTETNHGVVQEARRIWEAREEARRLLLESLDRLAEHRLFA